MVAYGLNQGSDVADLGLGKIVYQMVQGIAVHIAMLPRPSRGSPRRPGRVNRDVVFLSPRPARPTVERAPMEQAIDVAAWTPTSDELSLTAGKRAANRLARLPTLPMRDSGRNHFPRRVPALAVLPNRFIPNLYGAGERSPL